MIDKKPHTLVTYNMAHLCHARDILENASSNVQYEPDLSQADLLSTIWRFDAIITNLHQKITAEVIDAAKNLKLIATPSTGTDHIDVNYAASKGIMVQSLKDDIAVLETISATAEHAFLLMLASIRHLPSALDWVKAGNWASAKFRGREAAGRTVGIIGYGRLGKIFARLAHGFGMTIYVHDPYKTASESYVTQTSLSELLDKSEIISLHVHLAPETQNMIGEKEFKHMRLGTYLINTSRGKLIDEEALLGALLEGKLAGAGLDVLADELDGDINTNPLVEYARTHDNLTITPHIGGRSTDSQEKAFCHTAKKLADFFTHNTHSSDERHATSA